MRGVCASGVMGHEQTIEHKCNISAHARDAAEDHSPALSEPLNHAIWCSDSSVVAKTECGRRHGHQTSRNKHFMPEKMGTRVSRQNVTLRRDVCQYEREKAC
jgi:hypothetical protein